MTVPTGYKRTWKDWLTAIVAIPSAWVIGGLLIELITIAHERQ